MSVARVKCNTGRSEAKDTNSVSDKHLIVLQVLGICIQYMKKGRQTVQLQRHSDQYVTSNFSRTSSVNRMLHDLNWLSHS